MQQPLAFLIQHYHFTKCFYFGLLFIIIYLLFIIIYLLFIIIYLLLLLFIYYYLLFYFGILFMYLLFFFGGEGLVKEEYCESGRTIKKLETLTGKLI